MNIFFQILLVIVVLGCFMLSNRVLNGKFMKFGIHWMIADNPLNRISVLSYVFPKQSRCLIPTYGTGGGLQYHNMKCIVASNSITQYVFLIMWFWYVALLVINSVNVLINILMMGPSYHVRALYLTRAVGSRKVF